MDEEEREFSFRVPPMWEWGLGLGSSHASRGFFLLLIVVLLPGIHCALGSVYYASYEIVIPKRLMTSEGEEGEGKISYSIFMRGKRQVIHLKQKRGLFAKNLPVYTYYNGKLGVDMPFLPDDCYYDGYVESDLGSLVSLSTCSGLEGIITIEKTVYNIEPIDASSEFEHVLYKMKKDTLDTCKGPKTEPLQFRSHLKGKQAEADFGIPRDDILTKPMEYMWSHTKYVEIFIVVDKKRYQKWGGNVTKTTQKVMDIISQVDTFIHELNTRVVMIGLEIWTEKNPIAIPRGMRELLPVFNTWRDRTLFHRAVHDVAHLIVGHNPGTVVGDAYFKGACTSGKAAAVASFFHEDINRFAALMSHELGHNLGMMHDYLGCFCSEYSCIMHEFVTHESHYSNCSMDNYYEYLRGHLGSCLYNKPDATRIMRKSICGNRVLDRGEECDCGSVETCSRDPCCLPTCRMTRGSSCAFGPCCERCQFRLRGSVCRPSRDECDLPEYCSGTSMWCQPDVYKQDGTRCAGEGLCYGGHCRDLNKQCVEIFGKEAISARDGCYQFMNTKGDRFGNCGSKYPGLYKHFLKCAEKDAKCGKIICEKVLNVPQSRDHHTFIHVMHAETWCWAADLFEETDIPDRAQVPTGTRCGPNKICISHVCSDARLLKLECNPATKCHGRGVCNNLRHCHCDYGYAPPTCETGGHGGSMDSGPPPTTTTTTTTTPTTMTPTTTTTTTTPTTTTTTTIPTTTTTTTAPTTAPTTTVPTTAPTTTTTTTTTTHTTTTTTTTPRTTTTTTPRTTTTTTTPRTTTTTTPRTTTTTTTTPRTTTTTTPRTTTTTTPPRTTTTTTPRTTTTTTPRTTATTTTPRTTTTTQQTTAITTPTTTTSTITTTQQTTITTTPTLPPPIHTFPSQNQPTDLPAMIITPSRKLPRRGIRENTLLPILLFLVTLILLVNSVIWYLIILGYTRRRKRRKKQVPQNRPTKANVRRT